MNHTLADLGRSRHNMMESIENTMASTTRAHGKSRDKGKYVGENSLVVRNYLEMEYER